MVADTLPDEIKIDRSLLKKNCEDERERIILEIIFLFATRLNMRTVAEGVETMEQLGSTHLQLQPDPGILFCKTHAGRTIPGTPDQQEQGCRGRGHSPDPVTSRRRTAPAAGDLYEVSADHLWKPDKEQLLHDDL